jgi:AcrR family transcriptional regulator
MARRAADTAEVAPVAPAEAVPAIAPVDRLAQRAGVRRSPGARGLRTRERLLDTAAALVEEVPYRELTSGLVAARTGLTPPAFYRYFADVNDVILELTGRMRESAASISRVVREGDWEGAPAEVAAAVVDGMVAFWGRHRGLYRVTDLLAEEGDARFARVKATTFAELTDALRDVVAAAGRTGRAGPGAGVDPYAVACVVVTALVHTVARESAFEHAGVTRAALRRHVAGLVAAATTGRPLGAVTPPRRRARAGTRLTSRARP